MQHIILNIDGLYLEKIRIVAPQKKVISDCSTPPDTHTLHNEHALSKQK